MLSEALRFSLDDEISSPHSSDYGGVVGGVFAIIIFIVFVVAIFAFAKSKNLLKLKKASEGVAFENPSYLKEANIEQVTVSFFEKFPRISRILISLSSNRFKQFHQILNQFLLMVEFIHLLLHHNNNKQALQH